MRANNLAGAAKDCWINRNNNRYAKAPLKLLADLEHEFRFSGHPIWLGASTCEHERHLCQARRGPVENSDLVAGRTNHRPAGAADHWLDERSYMVLVRTAAPLF